MLSKCIKLEAVGVGGIIMNTKLLKLISLCRKMLGFFGLLFILAACSSNETPEAKTPARAEKKSSDDHHQTKEDNVTDNVNVPDLIPEGQLDLSYMVDTTDLGFGYTISVNGKPHIKQEHIPGVQGLRSFESFDDAETAAKLVIQKMKDGHGPTLSIDDLKQLNIQTEI